MSGLLSDRMAVAEERLWQMEGWEGWREAELRGRLSPWLDCHTWTRGSAYSAQWAAPEHCTTSLYYHATVCIVLYYGVVLCMVLCMVM